ncbi:hypothetical protein Cgig2_020097 [Carnegiea gigantea]|uniref:AB hydrolase-1 domain-containing protein n=1 Tax=Carnegiea gigantea TaxID=171969 RepID=A0A9Q1KEU9_9CARY|nr:hypothetical protein Cgig2_020097 [Carnegiea gigantea]
MEKNTVHVIVVSFILTFLSFDAVSASSKGHDPHHSPHEKPKHFVLVHRACLGAWSWYKLIPPLRSHGHNVTAIDLAASGINLARTNEIQTFSDYSKPLIDFMESVPETEKIILVGHSLGGVSISQAMELFPHKVSLAVFVTAFMPGPSFPYSVISQKIQEWMIEKNPTNRVERIGGSNRMVITSQPAELVACLLGIAQDLS